ncbi:MAG: SPOR domain-containing protein [Bacteroidales bacterium]|jgi:hypothetical protein|nr:SPOR domain-containing protein [Bacteroidales bacterium]
MKQFLLLFLILFVTSLIWAQKNVAYNIEPGINNTEQQYLESCKKIKRIDGFRIQIISFSGVNSKTMIEQTAEQFRQHFPEIPFHISYFEPNFRLRVGNFRTKIEAYKALQKISNIFSGAFVLKDQIDIER